MPEPTESAALLQNGAMYTRRIGLRRSDTLVFAGRKRGAFSLYFDDEPIYHFDLEGRWQRAFVGGAHFLKGLDGAVRTVDRTRETGPLALERRPLPFAEAADLDARARQVAIDLLDQLGSSQFDLIPPPPGIEPLDPSELRDLLERVLAWDASAWFAHRERFLATYGPPPYLPPDAHQAVILQATLGPTATFGSGRITPDGEGTYIRDPSEFAQHAREVATLLGRGILQLRDVFLGGSDVLRLPPDHLAECLKAIAQTFPLLPGARGRRPRDLPDDAPGLDGIATFLDRFEPPMFGVDDLLRLKGLGLTRVTLGIESGDPDLRAKFGKVWTDDNLQTIAADLDAAGIAVNLAILADPPGAASSGRHAEATAALVESLPLRPGAWVTLVAVGEPSPIQGLDPIAQWKAALGPARERLGIKVVPSRGRVFHSSFDLSPSHRWPRPSPPRRRV